MQGLVDLKKVCHLFNHCIFSDIHFRGHVRACMKGNEVLFEIIYIVVLWVWFHWYYSLVFYKFLPF